MNYATITLEVEEMTAEKKPSNRKTKTVPVDVLLGDGQAVVGHSMNYGRAFDYGSFKFGGSVHVSLHCNQDPETVKEGLRTSLKLCKLDVKRELMPLVDDMIEQFLYEEGEDE